MNPESGGQGIDFFHVHCRGNQFCPNCVIDINALPLQLTAYNPTGINETAISMELPPSGGNDLTFLFDY